MRFSFLTLSCRIGLLVLCLFPLTVRGQTPAAPSSGDAPFAAGQFEQARQAYALAEKINPNDILPRVGLIRTLLRLDNWSEALAEAQSAAQKFPGNADTHGLLALTLIRAGWQEPYAKEAAQSLALNPKDYWGLVASGRAAEWDGNAAAAHEFFRQAATAFPDLPDAWLGLIHTLSDEKDTKEKGAVVQTYLRLAPHGHPHDREREWLLDFQTNAPAYRRNFEGDPPFQQVKSDNKPKNPALEATIKVEFVRDYAVFPVSINALSFRLLFDTGAGGLLLSQDASRRLKLPTFAHSYISGVSGRQKADVLKADRLTLGSLTYRSILIRTMGFSPEAPDGILGGSTLDDCVITLDYTTATATLSPDLTGAPSPMAGDKALPLPFRIFHNRLFLPVVVNSKSVWAMLDTGAEASFLSLRFARDQVKILPKNEYRTWFSTQRAGIGDSNRRIGYLYSPDQSEITLSQNSPVSVETETIGESSLDGQVSPDYDFEITLLLGVSSLTYASRLTFDYPRHLLTFEYKDPDAAPPAGAKKK